MRDSRPVVQFLNSRHKTAAEMQGLNYVPGKTGGRMREREGEKGVDH